MKNQNAALSRVAGLLKKSESVLFITGAGISADSGLPTYRGIGGLYNDSLTDEGVPIEEALSGETLRSRPDLTWKYLAQIEKNCRGANFNRGHEIIARMEKRFPRAWVLTQNIDGFHRAAGSRNVIDIHGDMRELSCVNCAWRERVNDYSKLAIPPKCPRCGSFVRPAVVFFGEMLPPDKLETLRVELSRGFDICFTIGTTSVFPYIQQPILLARSSGKPTVEINPGETEVSRLVDIRLRMRAVEALVALDSLL